MNVNPLPVAELLPAAPGSAPASPGVAPLANLPNAADASGAATLRDAATPRGAATLRDAATPRGAATLRDAATFAALLQNAGLAAEALAAEDAVETQRAEPPEGVTGAPAPGSALDGLLFLAHVQTPAAAPATTAQASAAPPSAESAPESAAPLAARVPQRGIERPDTALLPQAFDTERPAVAGASAPAPSVGLPSIEAAKRPALKPVAFDSDPLTGVSSEPVGERAAPKSDPPPAYVLPSLEAAKRPAVEALAAETKPVAAAPSPDPTPSMTGSANAPSSTPAPVIVAIDTPVNDPAWRGEAAGRMASLVTQGVEHAELRLSPAELGPVEVRIDVRGGEATLAIVATQATTRDALEQALPLLRDMLAQQGLSLGEATVHDGHAGDPANSDGHAAPRAGNATRSESTGADDLSAPRPGLIRRLVDVFA